MNAAAAGVADEDPPNVSFASFVRPFARLALRRFDALPARGALAAGLVARLAGLAGRALLAELARDREAGVLAGADGRARFHAFSDAIAEPGRRRRILDAHPGLERALSMAAAQWAATTAELLARYEADRVAAGVAIHGAPLAPAAAVTTQLSDPHRGGRSVARVVDEAGRAVMYKPRSLALDERVQSLLAWLEEGGIAQRRLRVVDRGTHGWTEVVAPAPCVDAAAVDRFYFRQGSLLALLHVLRGVDFHHENVIAAGEHPVLVDLEALFQHRVAAARPGVEGLIETGYLPRRVLRQGGRRGVDLSGLGGPDGEAVRVPGVVDVGLDTMRLAPRELVLPPGRNRPVLDGRARPAAAHVDALVAGFSATWGLLARRRDALRARLADFAGVEVRFFARATQRYVLILSGALPAASLEEDAALRPLIESERLDLAAGDVPVFLARPGSRDVWDARGRRVAGFFVEPSLDECARRLDALDDQGGERHAAYLRHVVGAEA